jgi:hypothetical protein
MKEVNRRDRNNEENKHDKSNAENRKQNNRIDNKRDDIRFENRRDDRNRVENCRECDRNNEFNNIRRNREDERL